MSGFFSSNSQARPVAASLRVSTSAQGMVIPIVWGRARLSGNLMYIQDFKATAQEGEKTGKGGSGKSGGTGGFIYSATVLFGMCMGEVKAPPLKQWVEKNKYTGSGIQGYLRRGTNVQNAFSFIDADYALPYRRVAYWGMQDMIMGTSPNMPAISLEVETEDAYTTQGDALVSQVIADMLTNEFYGAGFPITKLGNLAILDNYTRAAGIFISPVLDTAQETALHFSDIMAATNCAAFWSQGLLKFGTYADQPVTGDGITFTPDMTPLYDLTDDDYITSTDAGSTGGGGGSVFFGDPGEDPVVIIRTPQADAYNSVKLEYENRNHEYNTAIAVAKDQASIETYGLREKETIMAHFIRQKTIAQKVAQTILQRGQLVRNTYTFKLGWKYCLLEPMDLVTLTDSGLGLDRQLVRILEITEDDAGTLTFTAEQVNIGAATAPLYDSEDTDQGGTTNTAVTAQPVNVPVLFDAPLALTGGINQIWAALSGQGNDPNWGGADVWVSTDGTSYTQVGSFRQKSRQGELTATFASGTDPDTTHTLSVDLSESGGTLDTAASSDADAGNTVCYVGGEFIAYSAATLTAPNTYDLDTYIRRGLYGSTIASHATGALFARLDAAIFKYQYENFRIAQTLFFKFPSVNVFNTWVQDLSTCTAYTYTLTGSGTDGGSFGGGGTASGSQGISISSASIQGTTPLLVGSGWLPAGTYQPPEADMGCGNPTDAATVKLLERGSGTLIAAIGGSAGGVDWVTASAGFSLAADTYVDVTLEADSSSATAYIRGLRVRQ